ncbi:MAG: ribosome recycling factor [Clostridia bacterium]|nr:ribosome recycling factor [Clostridia bacterium]
MKLDTKDFEAKMQKSIASLESNLSTIRAGQANPAILSKVSFEYYGSPTPVTQMADVRVADSKTITITPYDGGTLKAIEKAILASDIGITPSNDGRTIRLVFPQPTEERRRELAKQVQKYGEECKVAIRNIRRDANDLTKKNKKDGTMTEDEVKLSDKAVQDLTDKYIKNVDNVISKKETEVLSM